MKITQLLTLTGLLAAGVSGVAQVSMVPGGTYIENFDALGSSSGTWFDNSTLTGWYASVSNNTGVVEAYTTAYTATAGASGNSTTLYSMGTSGSSERALGGTPVSTRYGMLGWRLVNGSSSAITNLVITYDGEQWRRDATPNSGISVSYKIFSPGAGGLDSLGGWTEAPSSLTFMAPATGTTVAVNGNDAENRIAGLTAAFPEINLQPNDEIWIKWTLFKVSGGNIQIAIDNVTVAVPLGTPPVIGEIPDLSVVVNQTSVTNTFTVSDVEDDAASTPLPTPTAVSSNEAAVPSGNVFFDGTGSERTVYVVAGGTVGSADITVSLMDSDGNVGQQTFTVTVLPSDYPPGISTPPPTNTLVNTAVTIPFTVGDAESPANSLTVTGWVASYSEHIIAGVTLDTDESGTNRTVTVTPATDASGVGVVTLRVTDTNDLTATVSFAVMVQPAANIVFFEPFDYPLNTSIINSSPGFWLRRNASAQSINFRTYSSDTQAWIRPRSGADHGAAPLADRPFTPGQGAILYTMFKAQWIDVGDVPVVGDSDGAFILLAPTASATADQLVRVGTATNGVPEGSFRLWLSSGGNPPYATNTVLDLSVWGVYNIVIRYDVDTAQSTMWINASAETDPGLAAIDSQAPASVGFVCIRQMPGMGNILMDDLTVRVVYKPTLTSVTQPVGGNVDIFFAGTAGDVTADFEVERATSVTGPFNNVTANITALGGDQFKATAAASGDQSFYRVKRLPISF